MKSLYIKITLHILSLLLILNIVNVGHSFAEEDIRRKILGISYDDYINQYSHLDIIEKDIYIEADSYVDTDMDIRELGSYKGSNGNTIVTEGDGYITWEFNVPKTGLYNMEVMYFPYEGRGSSIERMLYINGDIPFSQARNITFTRIWKDVSEIVQDSRGNDIRPRQVEDPDWITAPVKDAFGYHNDPFLFYFEAGMNTITFESVREPMALDWIRLYKEEKPPLYKDTLKEYEKKGYTIPDVEPVKILAQESYSKSDMSIYPINDRTSPITAPQDIAKLRLNTIGRQKWQMPGQWIKWKFAVPESGLYNIATRFKQDIMSGVFVSRRVLINGQQPFQEAGRVRFKFSDNWQVEAFGDENGNFLFYFEEGQEYELMMEVTLGDLASLLGIVEDSMYALNEIYRDLLMIIGSSPDIYRDYNFDRLIPEAVEEMKVQSDILYGVSKDLEKYIGQKGQHVVLLDRIAFQLNEMWDDPDTIAPKFNNFQSNIGALGTWILHTRYQPLELDYILITPAQSELPRAEAGFFEKMIFEIKSFVMSFFEDYNSIGIVYDDGKSASNDVVSVWIATGRDQAQVIKSMIDDSFTPNNNIGVNLKLVALGTLLPSTLAGIGPDVSISNPISDPINFAIRGAVYDLTEFDDFDDIIKRFHESSLLSYQLEGAVYALPETQTFPMFFYRTDIFAELGLEVPKTWDDFYNIIPELQKKNMQMAFPTGLLGLQIFLYQMEGELYRNGASTNLDSDKALEAFIKMSELFTMYRFPVQYDFPNRFRTGEMPAGIVDFTLYNQLTVFAPEIRGLWEFVPLPGTVNEDGTINNSSPSGGLVSAVPVAGMPSSIAGGGTSVIMMNNANNKDDAWTFMKWWTSADTQARFGVEMESLLGPAAKHPTANMEALKQMPWSARDYSNLMTQWDSVVGTPEVPGGYYTMRAVDFASRRVYNTGDDPAETLLEYINEINIEISRKRREFRLE